MKGVAAVSDISVPWHIVSSCSQSVQSLDVTSGSKKPRGPQLNCEPKNSKWLFKNQRQASQWFCSFFLLCWWCSPSSCLGFGFTDFLPQPEDMLVGLNGDSKIKKMSVLTLPPAWYQMRLAPAHLSSSKIIEKKKTKNMKVQNCTFGVFKLD